MVRTGSVFKVALTVIREDILLPASILQASHCSQALRFNFFPNILLFLNKVEAARGS